MQQALLPKMLRLRDLLRGQGLQMDISKDLIILKQLKECFLHGAKRDIRGKKSPVLSTPGRQKSTYLAQNFFSSILVQCIAQSKARLNIC